MKEHIVSMSSAELGVGRKKAYRKFESFVSGILVTDRRSPQRFALNDWFALLQAESVRHTVRAQLHAERAFGFPADLALPSELEQAEEMVAQVENTYRRNLIIFSRKHKQVPKNHIIQRYVL